MAIIIFKPTHQCNLDCPFCYDRVKKTKSSKPMPVDKAIFALQKAMDTSRNPQEDFEIIWHGGEPTLVGADYIDQVCSHDYKHKIKWRMQTNMSLLTPQIAAVLKKHHIEIGGSWDGLAQENLHYHHTEYIKNSTENLGYAHLLFVVTPENCHDVIPSYLYALEHHYDMQFNPVFGVNATVDQYEEMAWQLVELFDMIAQMPLVDIPRPFDDIMVDISNKEINFCEDIFCVGYWMCIESDGTVENCGHPWPKDLQFGNIFDENFRTDQIQETPGYKKLAKHLSDQFDHCKDCKWLRVCKNRCPYTNMDPVTHEFKFNEGTCKFRSIIAENVYKIIKTRAADHTLRNEKIIEALHSTVKREFIQWRDYKSPTI